MTSRSCAGSVQPKIGISGASAKRIAFRRRLFMPSFETVRDIALALPGVTEQSCYGTPGFRLGKKFLSRLHQDGRSLVVKIGFDEREMLMAADPQSFYITDHYRGYPAMLVGLATVPVETLRRLLEQSWREIASKKAIAAYDADRQT
jgi:hypothetical protein